MSIQVENITKKYGRQKALDNLSFELKSGEIMGLLGPNGAGKSTLMKILTCFIPATSGKARVCGFDVAEQSLEVRRKVGYLPEHNPLYLEMYVREFLMFIAGIHKLGKAGKSRVEEMIAITGLGPEQGKKIGALSKGYRQRVGLAQAMMHNPEVLILDEPTSGLDPNQIIEIRTLIRAIGKSKTVMLSTHIMQEVEAVCDRAVIIHHGRLVANDLTTNLHAMLRQKNRFVVEFQYSVDNKSLKNIGGVTATRHLAGNTWILTSEADQDIRSGINQFAVSGGNVILSLQKEQSSIEDVFHELTREK